MQQYSLVKTQTCMLNALQRHRAFENYYDTKARKREKKYPFFNTLAWQWRRRQHEILFQLSLSLSLARSLIHYLLFFVYSHVCKPETVLKSMSLLTVCLYCFISLFPLKWQAERGAHTWGDKFSLSQYIYLGQQFYFQFSCVRAI